MTPSLQKDDPVSHDERAIVAHEIYSINPYAVSIMVLGSLLALGGYLGESERLFGAGLGILFAGLMWQSIHQLHEKIRDRR